MIGLTDLERIRSSVCQQSPEKKKEVMNAAKVSVVKTNLQRMLKQSLSNNNFFPIEE